MRTTRAVLVLLVLLSAAKVHADIININLSGGQVSFHRNNRNGTQQLTFTGLRIRTSDSANNTALTLNPGSAGNFTFTTVSGGQGLFSTPAGATFSAGTTASGILRGSINSVVLTGATTGTTMTTFTMQMTFSNMTFQNCSTAGCVNSTTLQSFSHGSTSAMTVSFNMANTDARNLSMLLAMTGNHNGVAITGGALDATVTPEPASLALFGTGLLLVGMRLTRQKRT